MRRGFTLVELLAVITVLALIMLIVIPLIGGAIDNTKKSATKDSIELYGRAIETAIADYFTKYPTENTVTLKQLEEGNFLKYKGKKVECTTTQIVNRKVYLSGCTVGGKETEYEYGKYDPTPELTDELVPVEYNNDKWVVADQYSDSWYNYDDQKWANAVILKSGVTKNVGDTVSVDGTEAVMMYVWIPRFEYNYKKLETELTAEEKNTPPAIEINFISKETTTPSSNDYKVHPAFTFGTEEKSGMWVGKFELSSVGENLTVGNNLGCSSTQTEGCTNNITNLRILPNVSSLRYNNVSNFFYAIKGIANIFGLSNTDIHMMKNSEWGAVAYLSQSKYGKYGNNDYSGVYKEVYQNKSENYITGSSNGTPSTSNSNKRDPQCAYNDMQDLGKDGDNKMGQCGPGASTTGTIYGVYDMSGGSWEYVMGAYGDDDGIYSGYSTSLNSGFTGRTGNDNSQVEGSTVPEPKYYDIYKTSTANTACDGVCYGHGLSETSGWYGDYADMVTSSTPWFVRGGYYDANSYAGVFGFSTHDGSSGYYGSARVVGFAK